MMGFVNLSMQKRLVICRFIHFVEHLTRRSVKYLIQSEKYFYTDLLQVTTPPRNHVGEDVQFPPHWGHMFPVCRGHHLWIYQHFRVKIIWVSVTPFSPLLSHLMGWMDGWMGADQQQ